MLHGVPQSLSNLLLYAQIYVWKTPSMRLFLCLDDIHIFFSYTRCKGARGTSMTPFIYLRIWKLVRIATNLLCFHRYLSLCLPSPCASYLPTLPNSLQNNRPNRQPPPLPETATSVACTLLPTWTLLTPHRHTWPHHTWPHHTLLRRTQHHRTLLHRMSLPRTPLHGTSLLITRTALYRLMLLTRTSLRLSLHRTLITHERRHNNNITMYE